MFKVSLYKCWSLFVSILRAQLLNSTSHPSSRKSLIVVVDNDFNYVALILTVKVPSITADITIRDAQIDHYYGGSINDSRITWYR